MPVRPPAETLKYETIQRQAGAKVSARMKPWHYITQEQVAVPAVCHFRAALAGGRAGRVGEAPRQGPNHRLRQQGEREPSHRRACTQLQGFYLVVVRDFGGQPRHVAKLTRTGIYAHIKLYGRCARMRENQRFQVSDCCY